MKKIIYTVDGEQQETEEKILTPRQILSNAGVSVETNYLILLRGESDQQKSFEGDIDVEIHIHLNMNFISASTGPTTVS